MDIQTLVASDMLTVTLLVTLLVGLLKPLVEALPFARPTQPAHDAALRVLSVVLNFGLLCGMLISQSHWDARNWYVYLGAALGQTVLSHASYKVVSGPADAGTASATDPAALAAITADAQAAATAAIAAQQG